MENFPIGQTIMSYISKNRRKTEFMQQRVIENEFFKTCAYTIKFVHSTELFFFNRVIFICIV